MSASVGTLPVRPHAPAGAPPARRRAAGRLLYLAAGIAAFAGAIHLGGWTWLLLVWAIAPDVPLFFGAGAGLARGQLHPRAVKAYNATHRLVGPVLVTALGAWLATAGQGRGVVVAGLVWVAHVTIDRACGYGLRTPEGFQQ